MYLDGEPLQRMIEELNNSMKVLDAEGLDTSELKKELEKKKHETNVLYNGKILEVKVSENLFMAYVTPTLTKSEIKDYIRNRNVILPMGLPNILSLAGVQFFGEGYDYPYKVGDMEEVRNGKEILPIVFDYPAAVKESFQNSPEYKFKEIHGVGDYKDVTHREMIKIGRSQESRVLAYNY